MNLARALSVVVFLCFTELGYCQEPPPTTELRGAGPQSKVLPQSAASKAVFIENVGQFDPRVRFQAKVGGQIAWLTDAGVVFDATRPAAAEKVVAADSKPSAAVNGQDPLPAFALKRAKPESRTIERLVFSEDFVAASCCSKVEGKNLLLGVYNYFQSRDSKEWRTNVRGYAEVVYRDIWPGIDLRIYGNGADLEQEFIVQPGGGLSQVQISYRGIDGLNVAKDGSLEVATAFGRLRETKPKLHQLIAGNRKTVDGHYRLINKYSYTFDVEAHSALYALVIDPTLLYSTFLGGSASFSYGSNVTEQSNGVAVDASGNALVAGVTSSTDFPTTPGTFQVSPPSGSFITKLSASGSALVYSTYLGQSSHVTAIAGDSAGNAFVTGWGARGFPTTPTAYWPTNTQQHCAPGDFFITELNATGNQLVYSSCFNISGDVGNGVAYGYYPKAIAVDPEGKAYIAGGASPGANGQAIPTTSNAYELQYSNMPGSAFVTVFDTTATGTTSLYYSTYLGVPPALNYPTESGTGYVYPTSNASGIAVDSFGKIYIAGVAPLGFPVTQGAYQTVHAPNIPNGTIPLISTNSFVAKLDPTASGSQSLIYSTFFGGEGDTFINAIAVDASGNAYVTGTTAGGFYNSFPATPGAFQGLPFGSGRASFVTKFNPGGSRLVYSTFLSSTVQSFGNGIAVDSLGDAYITGQTQGSTFPVTPDAFQSTPCNGVDCTDAFLAGLNPTGSGLLYSTYLGGTNFDSVATGVAVDTIGDVYVTGYTESFDFPTTSTAFDTVLSGGLDAFVTKFPLGASQTLAISSLVPTSGGNTSTVSAQIFGTGFHSGATVRLNCSPTIVGINPTVGLGGRSINATFDLKAASPSTCDVVVTNPDGNLVTLSQAFTVRQGGTPSLSLQIVGLGAILAGIPFEYDVVYRNDGNVDAYLVPIWIQVPGNLTWFIPEIVTPPTLGSSVSFDWSKVPPQVVNVNGNTVIPLLIPRVAAHSGGTVRVMVTVAASLTYHPFNIAAWISEPWLTGVPQPSTLPPLTSQELSHTAADTSVPSSFTLDWLDCITGTAPLFGTNLTCAQNIVISAITTVEGLGSLGLSYNPSTTAGTGVIWSMFQLIWSWTKPALIDCGLAGVADFSGYAEIVAIFNVVDKGVSIAGSLPACARCFQPVLNAAPCLTPTTCASLVATKTVNIVFSLDPNEKTGNPGIGTEGWVAGTKPLTYGIFFENEPTATAPAQKVTIIDPLSVTIDDLSTVTLGSIALGNQLLVVPPSANYSTTLDLRPSTNLLVGVNGSLSQSSGQLVWTFTSIDPATGNPPTDPTRGFLPPGGNGSVFFKVTPKSSVTTGTQVVNRATVVFDANAPISTPAWINTIDNTPPVSHVSALAATSTCPNFRVSWSGSDVGSGLQGFTIYVSDSGGPFTAWLSNTTAASGDYLGSAGHSYSIYSIATDLTGNMEGSKTSAEATTSVTASGPCGAPSLGGQISNVVQSGTTVTATLTLTNTGFTAAQAVNINQITFRTLSGSGTVTLANPVLPAAEGPLGIGASTTVPLTLNVPTTVTRFSMTEGGDLQDGAGNDYNYSMAQTVIP